MKHKKGQGYPKEWPALALKLKESADWKCERCAQKHNREAGYCLTVHHLDGVKTNLALWNLAVLCQRCHLRIQGRVKMDQLFMTDILGVSPWFEPHLKGYWESLV